MENYQILTEIEKAYLAGFVDGEGCITILKDRSAKRVSPAYTLHVIIVQAGYSGIDFLEMWRKKMGIGAIHIERIEKESNKGKARWDISANEALQFLRMIYPYLQLKQAEADLAIKFQITKNEDNKEKGGRRALSSRTIQERENIFLQMKEFKGSLCRRGRKPKANLA